jgi:hypothetical protein
VGKFEEGIKAAEVEIPASPDGHNAERKPTADQSLAKRRMRGVWLESVLKPVIADANDDIKARNLKFSVNAKEDDYSTFVEVLFFGYETNPTNLTVTIRNDGRVRIYILSGQGIDIGSIENPDRSLLEEQLVKFLELQTRAYLRSRRQRASTSE